MAGEFGYSLTSPRMFFPALLSPPLPSCPSSVLVSGWPFTVPGVTSRSVILAGREGLWGFLFTVFKNNSAEALLALGFGIIRG